MNKKTKYGQFYTKNSDYMIGDLIKELNYNKDDIFVDPFAGEMDLLNLIKNNKEAYDISPANDKIEKRDTLNNPPNYKNKIIITNPPWLAKNKNKHKQNEKMYEKYSCNDLYKCAMLSFINNKPKAGIIIIPLNFWCEENASIRKQFLDNFVVKKVKVFEEIVFADTTYTACAFCFYNLDNSVEKQKIKFEFWKGSKFVNGEFVQGLKNPVKEISFELNRNNDYIIGESYHKFVEANKNIDIQVERYIKSDKPKNTLVLHAQDTGSEGGNIKLENADKPHIDMTPLSSDRVFAGIKISKNNEEIILTEEQKNAIVNSFNNKINYFRNKYNSMCLTNYRNSTDFSSRKRISFKAAYSIIKWAIKKNNT